MPSTPPVCSTRVSLQYRTSVPSCHEYTTPAEQSSTLRNWSCGTHSEKCQPAVDPFGATLMSPQQLRVDHGTRWRNSSNGPIELRGTSRFWNAGATGEQWLDLGHGLAFSAEHRQCWTVRLLRRSGAARRATGSTALASRGRSLLRAHKRRLAQRLVKVRYRFGFGCFGVP